MSKWTYKTESEIRFDSYTGERRDRHNVWIHEGEHHVALISTRGDIEKQEALAKRIVDAVNEDPAELRTQRDDLLAALKKVADDLETQLVFPVWVAVKAAIKRAEGRRS